MHKRREQEEKGENYVYEESVKMKGAKEKGKQKKTEGELFTVYLQEHFKHMVSLYT